MIYKSHCTLYRFSTRESLYIRVIKRERLKASSKRLEFSSERGTQREREIVKMPNAGSGSLERSRSRGHHARSESETRPITETRLSSFSTGELGTTAGNDWAMLDPEGGAASGAKKKVMVVVDHSRESRLAMLWALSHIVHQADTVSLIHVLPAHKSSRNATTNTPADAPDLKNSRGKLDPRPSELGMSLKMLCTSRRPEVEIEVMTVEGADKGPTIVNQAKKLEASVLVLGQRKPSLLQRLFQRSNDAIVDYCIENAECLTLAVRKKSKQMGGYLINSRWQKNFWLLA